MFEGLKKKFSKFINSVSKKEEELTEVQEEQTQEKTTTDNNVTPDTSKAEKPENLDNNVEIKKQEPLKKEVITEKKDTTHINKTQKEEPKINVHEQISDKKSESISKINEPIKTTPLKEEHSIEKNNIIKPEIKEEKQPKKSEEITPIKTEVQKPQIQKVDKKPQTQQEEPKVSFGTRLRGVFSKEVSVKESDIEPFLEDLKMSLLESDVNFDAAEKILDNIKIGLLSNKISSKNINTQISNVLRSSIQKILEKRSDIDLLELAKSKKNSGEPFKILFIGPNGAGKTTTMAKLANMFIKNSFSVVLSASDTFRAAAIEQTAIHAERLHIGVIKGKYGSDPASVAFDAVAHAKAHHINVVLIDSAGRQETNRSLMEEIKKIVRITNPDIKIFVGESITGNSLLEQVSEFNKTVGLDGVILTKLDCDAKGGNTLSILSETSVPVLFFGVGEGYDDLMKYNPEFIINNMIAS